MQSLYQENWPEKSHRMDELISDVITWLLSLLERDDVESEIGQKLVEELKNEVVKPAVSLGAMLRQRYRPVVLNTSTPIDSAIRNWTKSKLTEGKETVDLEIVILPELKQLDIQGVSGKSEYRTLVAAQTHVVASKEETDVSVSDSAGSPKIAKT